MAYVFSHGGDFGDSIYSLMALHELWRETGEQTDYRLYHRLGTRMAMDEKHAEGLLPLIRSQPYIRSASWSPAPVGVRLCESTRRNFNPSFNLADMYTNAFGLPIADRRLPWLYVPEPKAVAPVVVARSPRYRSQFPWTRVYQKVKDRAVFVGLPDEHRDFCRAIGKLPYHPTADMAELAAVIAGAKLFCANQSAGQAVAESLKVPILIERPHDSFVTHWDRPDAWYAHRPRDPLPDIDGLLGLGDAEGVRLDHGSLAVGAPDKRYNGGLLEDGDGYLIAFRAGPVSVYGGPSRVWVARLDRDFRPTGEARQLALDHPECSHSQEDPRLFRYQGRAHVSFTGVSGAGAAARPPSVLYCQLLPSLEAGLVHCPHYAGRATWEKNWVFFEYDGQLHAVYSTVPHKVLRIDGDAATEAAVTAGPPQWGSGVMRGGASPVLVGDRWYHFFHGKRAEPNGRQSYHVGCLTFEARPPFRVLACTPHPLYSAATDGRHSNGGPDDVAFVGGAVRVGGDWAVSMGFADQWIEVRRWPAADVEAALVRV